MQIVHDWPDWVSLGYHYLDCNVLKNLAICGQCLYSFVIIHFNYQCNFDCQLNFGIVLQFFLRVFEESEKVEVLVSNSADSGLT